MYTEHDFVAKFRTNKQQKHDPHYVRQNRVNVFSLGSGHFLATSFGYSHNIHKATVTFSYRIHV